MPSDLTPAVRRAQRRLANSQRTVVVAAADLSHVGPVFGDPSPVDIAGRAAVTKQDEELIETMTGGRADDFFSKIAIDGDRRHVCGVPPIYIALSALCGLKGTPTGYAICPASEDGTSVVSICGVLYHQEEMEDTRDTFISHLSRRNADSRSSA